MKESAPKSSPSEMTRRNFLVSTVALGAIATTPLVAEAASEQEAIYTPEEIKDFIEHYTSAVLEVRANIDQYRLPDGGIDFATLGSIYEEIVESASSDAGLEYENANETSRHFFEDGHLLNLAALYKDEPPYIALELQSEIIASHPSFETISTALGIKTISDQSDIHINVGEINDPNFQSDGRTYSFNAIVINKSAASETLGRLSHYGGDLNPVEYKEGLLTNEVVHGLFDHLFPKLLTNYSRDTPISFPHEEKDFSIQSIGELFSDASSMHENYAHQVRVVVETLRSLTYTKNTFQSGPAGASYEYTRETITRALIEYFEAAEYPLSNFFNNYPDMHPDERGLHIFHSLGDDGLKHVTKHFIETAQKSYAGLKELEDSLE